jgi:hypothetical protein
MSHTDLEPAAAGVPRIWKLEMQQQLLRVLIRPPARLKTQQQQV